MDTITKSLDFLKKYLSETSLSERAKVWKEIKELDIAGPSVDEYLYSIQESISDYNNSFSTGSFCDDVDHARKFNELFNKVQMQNSLIIEDCITIPNDSSPCQEGSTRDCVYAFAA
jgi:hypothetical protein